MKAVWCTVVFFVLTASPVAADKYLDSLKAGYRSAVTSEARYDALYRVIQECLETAHANYHPDSISGMLDQAIEELRATQESPRFESFLHLKAVACVRKKKYDLAESYCDSCIGIMEKFHDPNELGSLFMLQEMIYRFLNLNERRVRSLYKAIENFKKAGSFEGQAGAYFTLGNIYAANLQDDLAIKSFLQGAEIRNRLMDSIGAGIDYLFCAAILTKRGDLKTAGEFVEKGKPVIHSRVIFQPLYYYIISGRWLKAMHRDEEALHNLDLAAALAIKGNQRYQRPTALCEMAEIYLRQKKYEKAIGKLEEAKAIASQERFLTIKIAVRKALSEYYEATGKPLMALEEYRIMQALKDSSNQNELSRALTSSAMEAEYNIKDAARAESQRIKDEQEEQKLRHQKLIALAILFILVFVGIIACLLYRSYRQKKKANMIISAEKKRSDDLLRNILPEEVAQELKSTGRSKARDFRTVTVLFTDFKNFTSLSEQLSPQGLVNEIHFFYSAFDSIISKYGVEKIKTIGDSYMCAGGLPVENLTSAENTVQAALEMRDFMEKEKQKRMSEGLPCFEIRIGLHSGPVVAGIVGTKKFAYDIWGDTVNLASRMESSGETGRVNISEATYNLVKDRFTCLHRGKIEAKHKGMVDMYFVEKA